MGGRGGGEGAGAGGETVVVGTAEAMEEAERAKEEVAREAVGKAKAEEVKVAVGRATVREEAERVKEVVAKGEVEKGVVTLYTIQGGYSLYKCNATILQLQQLE